LIVADARQRCAHLSLAQLNKFYSTKKLKRALRPATARKTSALTASVNANERVAVGLSINGSARRRSLAALSSFACFFRVSSVLGSPGVYKNKNKKSEPNKVANKAAGARATTTKKQHPHVLCANATGHKRQQAKGATKKNTNTNKNTNKLCEQQQHNSIVQS
jgi:hypothetical protein